MLKKTFSRISCSLHHSFPGVITTFLLLISSGAFSQADSDVVKAWVGTWSSAPQLVEPGNMPPTPGLSNNSLRQVVRVSLGGDSLRIRFSNAFSTSAVAMRSVKIAASTGDGSVDETTIRKLKFEGKKRVTMAPGTVITSDPVAFNLHERMDVAITICFGQTSATVTGHPGSRTTSYLLTGGKTSSVDFRGSVPTDHWYVISGIDVKVPEPAAAVAIIGNSITDGRGSETNKQNRWPDVLSERLLDNPETKNVGVLNLGIGGNCVLRDCLGPSALARFDSDILQQHGVLWLIILEGVNDIGQTSDSVEAARAAEDLIAAYGKMIDKAHSKGIRVYGATIMPFGKSFYAADYRETARNTVNDWIRNSGRFDAVIDFDNALRDPQDRTCLLPSVQSDYLHPNVEGYKMMGEAIDLELFSGLGATGH